MTIKGSLHLSGLPEPISMAWWLLWQIHVFGIRQAITRSTQTSLSLAQSDPST